MRAASSARGGRAGERRMSTQHLVRRDAEGVDVGAMIDVRVRRGLFRRHVQRRAERRAGARERAVLLRTRATRRADRLGHAEVGDRGRAPPAARRMLCGLMSRCTTPRSCAYASARATSLRIDTVSRTDSGPFVAMHVPSDSPSTYGMTKNGRPAASPALNTPTMCGCCNPAERRISRLKRSTDTDAARCSGMTFTATRRCNASSNATNTRDMPPPPSSRSMA